MISRSVPHVHKARCLFSLPFSSAKNAPHPAPPPLAQTLFRPPPAKTSISHYPNYPTSPSHPPSTCPAQPRTMAVVQAHSQVAPPPASAFVTVSPHPPRARSQHTPPCRPSRRKRQHACARRSSTTPPPSRNPGRQKRTLMPASPISSHTASPSSASPQPPSAAISDIRASSCSTVTSAWSSMKNLIRTQTPSLDQAEIGSAKSNSVASGTSFSLSLPLSVPAHLAHPLSNGEFEMTTSSTNNSYVQNGYLYITPTLTSDAIGSGSILNGYTYNLTDCTYNITNPASLPGGTNTSTFNAAAYYQACGAVSNSTSGTVINPVMSARVSTRNSASIRYGRVEVSAKLPRG